MSELLEAAFRRARERPEREQDELALGLLAQMAHGWGELRLSDRQVADVKATMARLKAGEEEMATDEEMADLWRRCCL